MQFIRRLVISVAVFLCSSAFAHAGAYGGYLYPSSGKCTPVCDGVRVTYYVPTPVYVGKVSESTDGAFIWVGISTGINTCSGATGNGPLMQVGMAHSITSTGTQFHRTWWEVFPCNNVQYTDVFTISPGDTVSLELLCITNCTTGDSTQVWQMTLTNITTSQNSVTTHTGFKVWMDRVDIVIEPWGDYPSNTVRPIDFAPVKFIHAEVHQGGAWIGLPNLDDSPASKTELGNKQLQGSPTWQHVYNPSTVIGGDQSDFYVCSTYSATSSSAGQPCPAATYSGTAGLGP